MADLEKAVEAKPPRALTNKLKTAMERSARNAITPALVDEFARELVDLIRRSGFEIVDRTPGKVVVELELTPDDIEQILSWEVGERMQFQVPGGSPDPRRDALVAKLRSAFASEEGHETD